jgi:hypothetical protein
MNDHSKSVKKKNPPAAGRNAAAGELQQGAEQVLRAYCSKSAMLQPKQL